MILQVEDEFSDVLSKAQKGQGISTEALAERVGVSENAIRAARRGEFDPEVVEALGKGLGLNVEALLQLGRGEWKPEPVAQLQGFAMVSTPFYDWQVNAFAVWDERTKQAIVFDTGTRADPLLELLDSKKLEMHALVLTHSHWDHVDAAEDLLDRWPAARAFLNGQEGSVSVPTESIGDGFEIEVGRLRVRGFDTPGHTEGGMSFAVGGLGRELAIVGDALFAGSMGGANVSYAAGLRSLRRILELPEDTVLAPGHGPLTTVGQERRMNCFAAF